MLAETLAVDIDHQNLDLFPAPLLQLLKLLGAGLDGLAADGAARDSHRLGHLRQHFLVFPRRHAAQQCAQHVLAQATILAQPFIGRNPHFPFYLVTQAGPLHFQLAVRQLHAAGLRSVVTNIAFGLTRRPCAGHLFGTQHQDPFQHLVPDLMDHVLDHLTGILDQANEGKQDLPIALTELLNDGGRLAGSARHDLVSSLHGGRLLSVFCVWQPDSIESAPTAAYDLQLNSGRPPKWLSASSNQ